MYKYNIIEINKDTTESKIMKDEAIEEPNEAEAREKAAERAYELNKEAKGIAKTMGLTEHPFSYDFVPDNSVIQSTPIKDKE
jgi:hypothetical protein